MAGDVITVHAPDEMEQLRWRLRIPHIVVRD
jgi:hypothetical protein